MFQKPLYEIGPKDLTGDKWEIVVVLEGMVEATGGTTQARASYLPEEIYWGRRFKNVVTRGQRDKGMKIYLVQRSNVFLGYLINFKHFHELYESNNPPKCSAREMDEAEDEKEDEEAVFSLGQSGSLEQEKFNFIKFLALRNHFYSAHTNPFNSPHKKFSC